MPRSLIPPSVSIRDAGCLQAPATANRGDPSTFNTSRSIDTSSDNDLNAGIFKRQQPCLDDRLQTYSFWDFYSTVRAVQKMNTPSNPVKDTEKDL
eukprot:13288408-Ditylum_brightwellii.AAC.2